MATRKSATAGNKPAPKKPEPKGLAKPRKAATKRVPTKPVAPATKPFAPKVCRFIDEYLVDLNGTAAYQRAGYKAKPTSAEANARRLLGNARIAAEIARRQAITAEKLDISREEALQEAWNIVKANPNELVEYRRVCCDSCYGGNMTDAEQNRDPNPTCVQCGGIGYGKVHAHDTRKVSAAARSLYAGVKITKEGFEVKMHSKLDALEKVFKHLGLYEKDNAQKQSSLTEALAQFVGGIHETGSRLPIAQPKPKGAM